MPEYELLKHVSIKALEEAGFPERELHRFAFLCQKTWPNLALAYGTEYNVLDSIRIASKCQGGIEFLLEKGFIRVKEITYHRGQRFICDEEEYHLTQVSANSFCMIESSSFNRYRDPMDVKDYRCITKSEISNMFMGSDWKLIK